VAFVRYTRIAEALAAYRECPTLLSLVNEIKPGAEIVRDLVHQAEAALATS
jgi:hypothetical protein